MANNVHHPNIHDLAFCDYIYRYGNSAALPLRDSHPYIPNNQLTFCVYDNTLEPCPIDYTSKNDRFQFHESSQIAWGSLIDMLDSCMQAHLVPEGRRQAY